MRRKFVTTGVAAALSLCTSVSFAADDAAMIKARQKFFGIENVDARTGAVKKDKVIASWATNTTYVVSMMGRVVLLDSYINRPELPTTPLDRRYTTFNPTDLVAVRPEAIFLGHGHGDHAHNAAFIAKNTGAVIYASPETCYAMEQDTIRMFNDPNLVNGGAKIVPDAAPPDCRGAVPAGSFPGQWDPATGMSKATKLPLPASLDSQICVLAFKHIHSGTAPVDPSFPHTTLNNLGDPRYAGRVITTPTPAVTYPAMYPTGTPFTPPTNPANQVPGQMNTNTGSATPPGGNNGGSIVIFYQLIQKGGNNFNLSWVNSSGPAKEGIGADPGLVSLNQYNDPNFDPALKARAAAIGQAQWALMETLPFTDVFYGSIVSLGAANNQSRDIAAVIQRLRPKQYIPGHITDVAQMGSGLYHLIALRDTMLNMGFPQSEWPEIRMLIDPNDFAVPQVYSVGDTRWANPAKAARVAQFCS